MYELFDINGATFIFSPIKNIKTASLGVFLKIGSRFESKKVKGIAHFLEHMLFKGSNKYSYLKIKREIEGRGGALNAFTSHEITGYYAHFLSKNLPIVLDILVDMVLNPKLKKDDIDKERNVILEEIKMYNDIPSSRAIMLMDRLLWKDHPLGEEVIGYDSTVKKINNRDLREFKNKYYDPSNMVISFSGDYNKEKIVKLLNKKIKKSKKRVKLKTKPPSLGRGVSIKTEKKTLEQSHLCLGFRGSVHLKNKRVIAQIINIILGANMSSRLFEELREKKSLCYEISTEVRKYKDSGAFLIHMGLDKSKITLAIKTILKELNKIKEKQISQKELHRAKDYLVGQLTMTLERPQARMFYLAENKINKGKIQDLDALKKEIDSISATQIMGLSKEIFNFKNIRICCVGNIDQKLDDRIKKALKKGGFYR